ncbi:MAG TPA: RNase P subunit p30 family protein [Candidatus Nanoarchaeia archaeon]|nr:RNase P subunit p30 family protein [Candidatus Nanoarchaeia archaeon]
MNDIIQFKEQPLSLGFKTCYTVQDFVIKKTVHEEETKKILNNPHVDIITNLETNKKADKTNSRRAGLNHTLCKLATHNRIMIAFNFRLVLHHADRQLIIGRMQQNVKLCRKYKTKMIIASFATNKYEQRTPQDLQAFGQSIGMTAKEAQQALTYKKKEPLIRQL